MKRSSSLCLALALLVGCSEAPKQAPVAPVKHVAPTDESRKMPLENRVSTSIVDDHMLDRQWLPGGTLGHYKKGNKEWDLVLIKAASPAAAADWLLDYKNELNGSKVIPSFGGFFGTDKGRPAFVFTKNAWFAGVIGLSEADADAVARVFASRIS
jgi:hypothetical protein